MHGGRAVAAVRHVTVETAVCCPLRSGHASTTLPLRRGVIPSATTSLCASAPRAPAPSLCNIHAQPPHLTVRSLSTTSVHSHPRSEDPTVPRSGTNSAHPASTPDRGPPSKETTQTDFASLDVLGSIPTPTTAIDACLPDGFVLDSGVRVDGGMGVLLVSGEAFVWRPWVAGRSGPEVKSLAAGAAASLVNAKGQFEIQPEAWGLLGVLFPKPDLIILGTGSTTRPLAPATRNALQELGFRIEVSDTRSAASQFNLLATERGTAEIAAAMIPVGWERDVAERTQRQKPRGWGSRPLGGQRGT